MAHGLALRCFGGLGGDESVLYPHEVLAGVNLCPDLDEEHGPQAGDGADEPQEHGDGMAHGSLWGAYRDTTNWS